jgi:hypothetical protein
MIQVIQEVDTNTGSALCNEVSCPTMSAGRLVPLPNIVCALAKTPRLTYTWLENGRPAKIPAPSYIVRVQRWIVGKIHDPYVVPTDPPASVSATAYLSGDNTSTPTSAQTPIAAGPTTLNQSLVTLAGANNDWIGKSSGFPQNFHQDVKSIIKQMFRCYAHLYHCHWDNPFWHINRHLELNSCFVHFITVAMYYDLLPKKDMEPLQGLVDIFVAQGVVPREAVSQHHS